MSFAVAVIGWLLVLAAALSLGLAGFVALMLWLERRRLARREYKERR